jgi:uncharacterized protein (TIGR03067 family)
VVVTLLLSAVLGAPGPKDPPGKPDPIVGVWTLEAIGFRGEMRPDPDGLRWEFTADGKYVRHRGDKKSEFRYELGPKGEPRALDLLMIPDNPDTGVIRGICKVDGDRLTIALPQDKRTVRPTDFETPKDNQIAVYVFKRVRSKD